MQLPELQCYALLVRAGDWRTRLLDEAPSMHARGAKLRLQMAVLGKCGKRKGVDLGGEVVLFPDPEEAAKGP